MHPLLVGWIALAVLAIAVTWWGLHGAGFKKAGLWAVLIFGLIALAVYTMTLKEIAP